MKGWADRHDLTRKERVDLCYFFAITYCVESAIVLYLNQDEITADMENWVKANKDKIIFQSDRKYIKMKNSFQKCLLTWLNNRDMIQEISKETEIDLNKWIPKVEKYPLFGRFSAYLYLETVAWLLNIEVKNAEMEWENGATATSGLLHIYGYDSEAEEYDKTRKLKAPFNHEKLQEMVEPVLTAISMANGDNNITKVETSLCAYRKFYKGTRYNGYYLDRMLEEIIEMRHEYPDISAELLSIRAKSYSTDYLGEIGGWNGIRKDMKKVYQKTGIIT